jgi:hypothetical protein
MRKTRKKTIRSFILRTMLKANQERMKNLKRLNAPDILLKQTEGHLKLLKRGRLPKIGGNPALLGKPYTSAKVLRSTSGQYAVFTCPRNEMVRYFPNAKYGPWIVRQQPLAGHRKANSSRIDKAVKRLAFVNNKAVRK